jgi:hypothetical protein
VGADDFGRSVCFGGWYEGFLSSQQCGCCE